MPMKVEAAIVTQKRPAAEFNTDSVNINGKVFSREVIKNGYKGSGVLSGNVFFALTSSEIEGFADAAVIAFNDRAEKFAVSKDPRNVFSGYYEDCRSALLKMGKDENDLVSVCLYASGRKVVLAKNQNAGIYTHRFGVCNLVTPESAAETVAEYENVIFPDVTAGDIFILLSPCTAKALSHKEIEDTLRVSDGSVKRIVSLISKVALAKEGTDAISVIAVKILETSTEEDIAGAGFVPDFSHIDPQSESEKTDEAQEAAETVVNAAIDEAEPKASEMDDSSTEAEEIADSTVTETSAESDTKEDVAAAFSKSAEELYTEFEEKGEIPETSGESETSSEESENSSEEAEDLSDEPETVVLSEEEEAEKRRIKSKLKLLIALSALLLLSVVMLVVILFARGLSDNQNESTTVAEQTTLEETTEEETSEEETSEEESTEEETSEEEAGTAQDTTTASRNEAPVNSNATTTTRQPTPSRVTTTEAPSVESTAEASSEETSTEAVSEEQAQTTTEAIATEEATADTSEENNEETTVKQTESITENTSSAENTSA